MGAVFGEGFAEFAGAVSGVFAFRPRRVAVRRRARVRGSRWTSRAASSCSACSTAVMAASASRPPVASVASARRDSREATLRSAASRSASADSWARFGAVLVVGRRGAGGRCGGVGVVGGAADGARPAVGEVAGQLGGHAVDAGLAEVEPSLPEPLGAVHPCLVRRLGRLQLARQGVSPVNRVEHGLGRVEGRGGCGDVRRFGTYVGQSGGCVGDPCGQLRLRGGDLGRTLRQPVELGREPRQLAVDADQVGGGLAYGLGRRDPGGVQASLAQLLLGLLDERGQCGQPLPHGLVLAGQRR